MSGAGAPGKLLIWGVVIAALAALPPFVRSDVNISVLTQIAIMALFALSYNLLLGEGGMVSFGHAVYFGLGGYCAIHVLAAAAQPGWWLPVPLIPAIGALGGCFAGVVFGYISTRHSGVAFPMITLGVVEMIGAAAWMFDSFFGGDQGVVGDRTAGPALFGFSLITKTDVYYCVVVWVLLGVAFLRFYIRTPLGRLTNAVRDNPGRCAFIGFDPRMIRYLTFIVSATLAGLAGGLSAVAYEIMTPDRIGLHSSGTVLLMAYIGGIHHFLGPVLGAAVITVAQSLLSDYTQGWLLYIGLFFVAVVLWAPGGLAGIVVAHAGGFASPHAGRLLGAYALAAAPAAILAAGMICVIELGYRLALDVRDAKLLIFDWTLPANSPLSWSVALALCVIGGALLRPTIRDLGRIWANIHGSAIETNPAKGKQS